jgi:hypothetical protein
VKEGEEEEEREVEKEKLRREEEEKRKKDKERAKERNKGERGLEMSRERGGERGERKPTCRRPVLSLLQSLYEEGPRTDRGRQLNLEEQGCGYAYADLDTVE